MVMAGVFWRGLRGGGWDNVFRLLNECVLYSVTLVGEVVRCPSYHYSFIPFACNIWSEDCGRPITKGA